VKINRAQSALWRFIPDILIPLLGVPIIARIAVDAFPLVQLDRNGIDDASEARGARILFAYG
jgi:hypothetical protein